MKNRGSFLKCNGYNVFLVCMILLSANVFAQEQEAEIELSFQSDSIKTCFAKVTAGDSAVKEVEVKFYVKRLFSLLPLGEGVETDENGMASVIFPNDLPGDSAGNVTIVAKMEDDENYGTVETQVILPWGAKADLHEDHWGKRSLSATRERAPMYLIIAANMIIAGVWGTLVFVIIQLFRIHRSSTL